MFVNIIRIFSKYKDIKQPFNQQMMWRVNKQKQIVNYKVAIFFYRFNFFVFVFLYQPEFIILKCSFFLFFILLLSSPLRGITIHKSFFSFYLFFFLLFFSLLKIIIIINLIIRCKYAVDICKYFSQIHISTCCLCIFLFLLFLFLFYFSFQFFV